MDPDLLIDFEDLSCHGKGTEEDAEVSLGNPDAIQAAEVRILKVFALSWR